jgi:DNA polymerase-4
MDCFYAAVEMRERPELRNQPIAVGGGSRRGVVTTCNYEARKFGIHSAMPGFKAREQCPHLIFLPVRFDLYRAESQRIRRLMHDVTPLVEPLSLDEAFLDVTAIDRYAWDLARELRKRIRDETGLTASAGVAANKMLAKIASDWRKPDGQFAITPDQVPDFMRDLPVRKLWGVGPKTADKLTAAGIATCGDLQQLTLPDLKLRFGSWGGEMYYLCRGEDDREVQPHRIRKSLSIENTLPDNLKSLEACRTALAGMVPELLVEIQTKASDRAIREAFVKVKFSDFTRTSCQRATAAPDTGTFLDLLAAAFRRNPNPVRLLGVGVRFQLEREAEPEWSYQPTLGL